MNNIQEASKIAGKLKEDIEVWYIKQEKIISSLIEKLNRHLEKLEMDKRQLEEQTTPEDEGFILEDNIKHNYYKD